VNTPPYQLSAAIAPPAGAKITSFDISWVDPVRKRYYLANRTSKSVIVVDTTSNTVVGNFAPGFAGNTGNNNTSGPDGVLTTETTLWVGDAPSRVWALDPNTGAPIVAPIVTSTTSVNRADEGCYDSLHKVVGFVNNADSPPFITFISTATLSVVSQIFFDGQEGVGHGPNATNGAEQCQFNPRDGNVYLSLPEINGPGDNSQPGGVVVIDLGVPATPVILATYIIPQAACTNPQGLAIGPAPQIGLGCNVSAAGVTTNAIIQDSTGPSPGSVVMAFPGAGGCDEAWYNPGNNKYNVACRSANPGPEALFIIDAAGFGVQRQFTGHLSNGHSVASDPNTFAIYVPVSSASTSGLCSSQGAVDANGCILVYKPAPATAITASHDFNADANSDILWRNTLGQLVIWFMKGGSTMGGTSPGVMASPWAVVGQRDFNGDGTADILFRSGSTGVVAIWLISNGTVIGTGLPGAATLDWSVVGTGDFNGDGKGDILWLNSTTGQVVMWFMNGTTISSGPAVGPSPGASWTVAGVNDFNGDGKADILWRNNSTGQLLIWFMNGTTILSSGSPGTVTTDWVVAGTGEFDGDQKWDILWYNTTSGQVLVWLLNGTTVLGVGSLGSAVSPWSIQLTGDFNGDGRSDILWRNSTTGQVVEWLVKGFSVIGGGSQSVTTDWQIQTLNAD
jgi:hypothetical protein